MTGECLHVFEDHKLPVYALRFSPTGRWVATGSSDGWLHVYDVKVRLLSVLLSQFFFFLSASSSALASLFFLCCHFFEVPMLINLRSFRPEN